ncbi:MAG: HEAT repeat domain-containing protein [Thermodesulfobacteriota bacterium]
MPEDLVEEKKALDLSEEIPSVEGVETDEELILARDITKSLLKTIKAFRFYPPDHPSLKGFQQQLPKKFQFFLNKYNSFGFQIEEFTFSYRGKALYENRDVKTSLAFLFYRDGVRELRFIKGLEEWEIEGLIDIIIRCENINQMEDDVVTLMWGKDFPHISYLATDDFLQDSPALIPGNIELFRRGLVFEPIGHAVEVDFLEDEFGEGADLDQALSKLIEEIQSFVSNRSAYSLNPDETERLRREVEGEIEPTSVFNLVDILLDILAWEKDPEPYQMALNILGKILDAMLTIGNFQRGADLLKRLYIFLKTYKLQDWQIELVRKLIVEAGEDPRIERIGKVLEQKEGVRLEDVHNFLVLLQRNAITPLVKILGERTKSKTRRMLCDALSEIGKNAVDMLTPYLDDPKWYLVRNIVYILGRIGKEESVPYIQKAFYHEEPRVRREAIQALGLIGGPKAAGLLSKALKDGDVRVRSMAATSLGKAGKKAGLGPLLEVVQSKEFQRKGPTEIKAFFKAVGLLGDSRESILVLQQLLERKSWFVRGKVDEILTGAANALAMIGTPEAKAILDGGKHSKDEAIREACLQALKRIPTKESVV